MLHPAARTVPLLLLALGGPTAIARAQEPSPAAAEFFEKQVRPLLVERCLKCHGDAKPKGGLSLTSREHLLEGGDTGPAAVAGQPGKSLLIQAVHYKDTPKMPPKARLPDREIAVLTRWVRMGLPWPRVRAVNPVVKGQEFRITDEQRRFWSFQPVKAVAPPPVKDGAWPRSGLDRFVLATLEARGLKPALPADRRTLIRRATFDLTGLPPTPGEIDAFLRDRAPGAFARVVDRLLASPHYGERWGRHWLDIIRYTDSFDARGIGGEMDIADAWRYRDWVAAALNRDLPYNRFIVDQIAGDLVQARGGEGFNAQGTVATGMLAIGNWGGGDADKEKLLTDIVDDQIDVVSRSFLGLTLACARCHDHKFDPLSTEDYYGVAGIFFSTHILPNVGPKTNGPPMLRIPLLSGTALAQRNRDQARVADLDRQIKAASDEQYHRFARQLLPQTAKYVTAAWEYQNRPAAQARQSVGEAAARRGLYEYALRQWIEYLAADDYRLMTKPIQNVNGRPGVHAWRGEPDCPSLTVNTTGREVAILTFKLPPRSVAVHPGPNNGVAVRWKSPITGTVRITGRVADADPVCGDGIAWIIDQRTAGGRRELAGGDIANGGSQSFAAAKTAGRLNAVPIQEGDHIELLVLPKANHACDTTVVELVIARQDGSARWDLTRDLVADPLQGGKGNPHSDRLGHKDVWHFLDMADSPRARQAQTGGHAALLRWQRFLASATTGKPDRARVEEEARAFQKAFDLDDARSPFWIRNPADSRHLPAAARETLTRLAAERDALKGRLAVPVPLANGAQEGGVPGSPHAGIHDVKIHIRGSYSRLGPLVPRRFPVLLAGTNQPPITRGSGRLQLAEWIASPEHPLTARVMVNRLWQYHFGEGIVRTPSNFGKLGERPTHPELLDYLAREFVRGGWSMKKMHRLLMLSAAYRQSSAADAATLKADPGNLLFGRMNRRRLEAEAIRDNLLAVAGRLDPTAGGPATRDFSSPRRTLYLMTVRSDRAGFRPLFDVADSTAPVDRRVVSTVAPQALFLLNHPFVLEQTRRLARRELDGSGNDTARIQNVYVLLFGRPPTTAEDQIGRAFLTRAAGAGKSAETAWEEYCQVLLCTNEFIYVD
jgi:hypothetical protein